jgi:hypothetical protein
MSTRRGGIPGPESRTGLVRPSMSEAEFERREGRDPVDVDPSISPENELSARGVASPSKSRVPRAKPAKARRVQRMFAIDEDIDKKLWLYAIHVGKDRSEVVNELLKPLVASMVLYDSRDRRASARALEAEGQGGEAGEGS